MSEAEIIMPRVENQTAAATTDAVQWAEAASLIVVETETDYTTAAQCLAEVKTKARDLEAQRQAATKPLLEAKRTVDGWFKPALDSLAKAEGAFKMAIARYQDLARAAMRAAMAEAQKAETATEMVAALAVVDEVKAPVVKGLSSRTVYKFDLLDAEKLPREYLVPDLKKIGAVVRTLGEGANIPGVRIYSETQISSRAGD